MRSGIKKSNIFATLAKGGPMCQKCQKPCYCHEIILSQGVMLLVFLCLTKIRRL